MLKVKWFFGSMGVYVSIRLGDRAFSTMQLKIGHFTMRLDLILFCDYKKPFVQCQPSILCNSFLLKKISSNLTGLEPVHESD